MKYGWRIDTSKIINMEIYGLLYEWEPRYLRLLILYILFFVINIANGVFLGNTIDMYSSLGVYAEPYTMAYNAMYIGMSLGLIFHRRMKMRLSNKTLLRRGLATMLVMNTICATSNNTTLIIFACLIIGFTKISALIEVYIMWMFVWSKKGDSSRMYPFVYFTALSGLYLVTWITTRFTDTFNWHYAYIIVIVLLIFCLLLTLAFVENHPLKKVVPLYQVDYAGMLYLASSMMMLNYAFVYGKVENWLESDKIVCAFFGAAITFLLFLKRQLKARHAFFDLTLFKRRNFCIGLLYFLLLGLFIPGTFQSAFSGSVLHYDMSRNTELNLYLVPGILAGCILCYIWYYKNYDDQILVISGFLSFVIYHILMYNNFVTEFDINYFWLPCVIKGFGTALLYISVGLYTTKKIGIPAVLSAAGAMILVRSFLGSGICSALYTYFLYAERIRRFNYLAGLTDTNNFLLREHGSNLSLYQTLQTQAVLTASKEISGYIIIAGLVLTGTLLMLYLHQKLKIWITGYM